MTKTPLAAILTASALVLAACGGGGGGDDATSVPSTTEPATTSTEETTTSSSEPPTSTTVAPEAEPVMPLTGEEILFPDLAKRPALAVKIDNHPQARPQSGLNEADIVFEENVENLTRFAAIFHGRTADPVGPIRSGRTQDIDILSAFNRPLFAWSGGNAGVTAAVRGSDLRDVGALTNFSGGGYYRASGRRAPHNLYAQGSMLMELAPDDAGPPPQQFHYREAGTGVDGGEAASGLRLSMDGVRVQWDWDEASGQYLRQQNNAPHVLEGGDQVSADNVVVLFVTYVPSSVDRNSPEAQTVGTGVAWVFTGGSVLIGTWTREDATRPFELRTDDGEPMLLHPGRTWVELARAGKGAIVPGGADPASVPYP